MSAARTFATAAAAAIASTHRVNWLELAGSLGVLLLVTVVLVVLEIVTRRRR